MLDHLDLNVADLDRSRAFYERLLERLGYRPFEIGDGWRSFIEPAGRFYLVLVQTRRDLAGAGYHRKRVGVNHLALAAPSREAVDELAAWLAVEGITHLYGGPMAMNERYAVYFEDPDRLKLEYVFRPA